MEEKIDLTKLLKDCPKGMPLDCAIFDNATLYNIESNKDNEYPIRIETTNGHFMDFTKYGTYTDAPEAKCLIFPKGKTTWEGFHRPFESGDILFIDCNTDGEDYEEFQYIFILKEITGGEIHCYCYIDNADGSKRFETCWLTTTDYTPRFASLIEKEKLFDAIKSRGYKWNDKEKKLEKLIVPNRFNPKTLEHFDKVLVRYDDDMPWCTDFFSYYDDEMRAVCTGEVHYDHCIPYNEDTKHLVGKLKDAPEFYKYWEAR